MFPVPPIVRLRFRQGTTHARTLTWKAVGVPVDLTGWSALMQVKTKSGDLAYELSSDRQSSTEGDIVIGGTAGTIALTPMPGPLTEGEYLYDLLLTDPAGNDGCLCRGSVIVGPLVTRRMML